MNRRQFMTACAGLGIGSALPGVRFAAEELFDTDVAHDPADHTLSIERCTIEISPGIFISTTAFNCSVPGPVLRLKEGVPVTIDVVNRTTRPDIVHWHGLHTDPQNDGAMEEGSTMIAPGRTFRYRLTPTPAGTRWYHTHNSAYSDLSIGTYAGEFGFLLVEGKDDSGHYDQEVLLSIHHWVPRFVPMADAMQRQSANMPAGSGSDVGYKYATINAHRLGAGEPIRVRQGRRVLFRILNASATENVTLALPGHEFQVIAMDGNPVPHPATVNTLHVAVGERIDCIVTMKQPGVWIFGSTLSEERAMGLGVVVEYEDEKGPPMWLDPAPAPWDYSQFALHQPAREPDHVYKLFFKDVGPTENPLFDTWTINGKSWPEVDPLKFQLGKRYRLVLKNGSADQHPIHIHRHSFEVTRINQRSMHGLLKDTVNLLPLDEVTIDIEANSPGDTLYHCHMQLHMDFGFMGLIQYI
jgi:FtsP/CotA-like multicopper oxidase with cupredoxin domain